MKTKLLLSLALALGFTSNSPAEEPLVKERPQITVNVMGAVKNPSRIILSSGATVLDALATTGDATKDADLRKLHVLHKTAAETPDITTINVTDILSGKAKDVVLQDGDTVVLPERAMTLKY